VLWSSMLVVDVVVNLEVDWVVDGEIAPLSV
jgi:hypothetical protein